MPEVGVGQRVGCQVEIPGGREGNVYTVDPRRPKIGKKPREKNSSVLDTVDALWQYNVYPSDHIGRPTSANSKSSLILQAEAGCQHPVHEGAPGGSGGAEIGWFLQGLFNKTDICGCGRPAGVT